MGKEGQDPLRAINWGEIREPYISEQTQKLAGQMGQMIGKPASSTGEMPFVAPMNQMQQNPLDLINRMMGYGNFQPPQMQSYGQMGGIIPDQPPIYTPPTPPGPGPDPFPDPRPDPDPVPPQPIPPKPEPIPKPHPMPYPMPQPMPYPMPQPGVQPLPNMPMNQPMPYPGFSPLRRR